MLRLRRLLLHLSPWKNELVQTTLPSGSADRVAGKTTCQRKSAETARVTSGAPKLTHLGVSETGTAPDVDISNLPETKLVVGARLPSHKIIGNLVFFL